MISRREMDERRFRACAAGFVWVLCAGLALGSSGCFGRSPAPRQYTLGAASATAGGSSELAIGLGPVTFPEYLDRPQLVTRLEGSELAFDELNRWAGGFQSNVVGALADALGARLGTDRVFLDPGASPFPVAYQVAVDVHRFEGSPGGELVLRARWVVREQAGEGRSWSEETTIRQGVDGTDTQSLIAAHDAALDALAGVIAGRITTPRP